VHEIDLLNDSIKQGNTDVVYRLSLTYKYRTIQHSKYLNTTIRLATGLVVQHFTYFMHIASTMNKVMMTSTAEIRY
jgi:hypothetical protein